jgi:uncharacterized protein
MTERVPFKKKPLDSLLIKPAGPDCNAACGYCFYRDKAGLFPGGPVHRMSLEVLEETVRQALAHGGRQVNFGWQGGEPTLMGLDFFRRAVELQARHGRGKRAANGLQTNGLLLDREWARFLRENGFLVGLSLDGPEEVHDRYRRTAGGRGTWKDAVAKTRLLLGEGVMTNALVVVNDHSVRFPREIYGFLKDLGLTHMQFIPCVETDPDDPGRAAPFSVGGEELGCFLGEVFNLWIGDFKDGLATISVRFFDSVFHTYVGLPPPECTLLAECGGYLVVEHNGDVYSCDFFVEEAWKLGNVMSGRLDHMLNSARQREFGRRKAALPEKCRACRWIALCRGGCPKDRLRDPRDGGVSHFCRAFEAFFEHADARLRELAGNWLKARRTRGTRT